MRRQPSAVSPVCTRAVVASELDVLLTRLAIERTGDYDLIGRPVVHDGLARLQAPRHGHVERVSRVLLHGARPEHRAAGVTRLRQDGVFLYFDLALSSHCGVFRASVRLARSLLEHLKLTRWSVDELVVLYTLQEGAPSCYVLRRTASWCDMMGDGRHGPPRALFLPCCLPLNHYSDSARTQYERFFATSFL